jgi:small subunit ribosomal protein S20
VPNLKASIKDLRRSRKRAARNAEIRTGVKTAVKKAREALKGKEAEAAQTEVRAASRMLDRAATKGTIHKRAAARRKSRLAKQLLAQGGKAETSAPQAAAEETPQATEE